MASGRLTGAGAALAVIFFGFAASQAHAASSANRTWVSGHGTDAAGCGAPSNPCRSFQYAHDNIVVAGGEIDVLDPAGYGAIVIAKSISIVNDGVGTASVQQASSGANAITVNAGGSDAVILRGLDIDGLGIAYSGININSAGSVTVSHCVVHNFPGNSGIRVAPSSGRLALSLSDVEVSNSSPSGTNAGVAIFPSNGASVTGLVERATFSNNGGAGISVFGYFTTGTVDVMIVDSIAIGNQAAGFYAGSSAGASNTTMFVDNVRATGNYFGLSSDYNAVVRMNRSVFTKNQVGVSGGASGSTVLSFQNNAISGNINDLSGALTPAGQM